MAQTATNRFKYLLAHGDIVPGTTDLRMGLLKTLAAHTNVPDLNTVSGMEAHADFAELTASGYARVALTGEAASEDDTNDWALLDSGDVAFAAISSGETIVGAFIFIEEGGADSSREVLAIYDLTSTPTNGGTITVTTANGFAKIV
jgi:hypothetical protein